MGGRKNDKNWRESEGVACWVVLQWLVRTILWAGIALPWFCARSHGLVDGKPSSRSSHVFCTPKEIFPESCYCGIPHATCNELSDRNWILSIHLILLRSWWKSHLGCLSLNIPSDSDACDDGLLAAASFVIAAGFPSSALRFRVPAESEPPKHRRIGDYDDLGRKGSRIDAADFVSFNDTCVDFFIANTNSDPVSILPSYIPTGNLQDHISSMSIAAT